MGSGLTTVEVWVIIYWVWGGLERGGNVQENDWSENTDHTCIGEKKIKKEELNKK